LPEVDLTAVDPELRPLLELLPPVDLTSQTLQYVREDLDRRVRASQSDTSRDLPVRDDVVVTAAGLGSPGVRALLHSPVDHELGGPVVLHFHGGGMVMGSPDIVAAANRQLAHDLDCLVVSVDYRLAPEHPYPAAVDDAYAVLEWINTHHDELGVDPRRLIVKGESAGGGVAAALALANRDRGEFEIRHQHLTYPMLDDRTCVRPRPDDAGRFVWTPSANEFGWQSYLGLKPGSEGVSQYAAPGRETDMTGLPPAYIAVGSLDLFCAESIAYAAGLIAAGGSADLHVYPGAFHSFASFNSTADVALRANNDSLRGLVAACQLR